MTREGIEQISDGECEHTFKTNVSGPQYILGVHLRWTDRDLVEFVAVLVCRAPAPAHNDTHRRDNQIEQAVRSVASPSHCKANVPSLCGPRTTGH